MAWKTLTLIALTTALVHGEMPQLNLPVFLTAQRRDLIEKSLKALEANPGIPYRFGGSSPEEGGMDCSGSVSYLLGLVGIDPPRSSQAQYDWIRESSTLTRVPAGVIRADDPAFAALIPGDLLFWGTVDADDVPHITHVQIYLGKEKDGRRVMIGASDGRSYRGVKKDGFDIVDFTIPKAESAKRILGFGPPVWKTRKK